MNYLAGGIVPGRLGNAHPNIVPYQVFQTADGYLVLAIANDRQFANFCRASARNDLAANPNFATNAGRVAHRETIVALLAPVLLSRTTGDWIAHLEAANVPCGPINRIDQVFADPQATARGLTISLPHADAGPVDLVASPLRLARTPPQYRLAPPVLGQHTDEVLGEILQMSGDDLALLRTNKII
jgi:crotonobetainyl-CoA:carnitine CoA-transferase CaiB-like acyl-CoA transferase